MDEFQLCEDQKYLVEITTLFFTPNPIVPGQAIIVNLTGIAQVPIEQYAKIKVQPIVFGFPVFTYENDFCKEVNANACPIPVGSFNSIFTIPNTVTKNLKNSKEYRTRITLINPDVTYDTDDTELFCLEGIIKIADESAAPDPNPMK
ncbi:2843_t:CDS:2 [Funneliformis geosporum]|uniref:Phosphatidylglycerol/phosphatidylinositol transfer protein n=1 Tax=Funneliformis geosporum TaxID=1117311 RepID=A0A9W4SAM2_9GLOM|nr:2843_t:CDS:2 [Funneliformis geosporum]CAI2162881.1 6534_t:CDS:2 [Funneliformis geosporum]